MGEIFVISRACDAARRASAIATLKACGLEPSFVDAWDGRRNDPPKAYDPDKARQLVGRILTPGEIGCYMSHLAVMRTILERGLPWAVVCEDDLQADADLADILASLASSPESFDLVKLESVNDIARKCRRIVPLTKGRSLVRVSVASHGTAGYLITPRGAEKFLAYSETFFRPVDNALCRTWENGLDIVGVAPFPIRQDPRFSSTIEPARDVGKPAWIVRKKDKLARRIAALGTLQSDWRLARRQWSEAV
jgi:glycosyl transferase family 25